MIGGLLGAGAAGNPACAPSPSAFDKTGEAEFFQTFFARAELISGLLAQDFRSSSNSTSFNVNELLPRNWQSRGVSLKIFA